MRIAIASDHGGFELKETVKKFLEKHKVEFHDFGCHNTDSVDYPSYGIKVGEEVAKGKYDKGIVICGTGIGISIAANKVKGIRCALVHDLFSATATRQHNDSNVLAMGGRVIGEKLALEIVEAWLNTSFEGGRHENRINLIKEYEEKK